MSAPKTTPPSPNKQDVEPNAELNAYFLQRRNRVRRKLNFDDCCNITTIKNLKLVEKEMNINTISPESKSLLWGQPIHTEVKW